MAWLLGFGIPLFYATIGILASRSMFRKHFRPEHYDNDAVYLIAWATFFFWPIAVVSIFWHMDGLQERKLRRELQKKKRIVELERELGL